MLVTKNAYDVKCGDSVCFCGKYIEVVTVWLKHNYELVELTLKEGVFITEVVFDFNDRVKVKEKEVNNNYNVALTGDITNSEDLKDLIKQVRANLHKEIIESGFLSSFNFEKYIANITYNIEKVFFNKKKDETIVLFGDNTRVIVKKINGVSDDKELAILWAYYKKNSELSITKAKKKIDEFVNKTPLNTAWKGERAQREKEFIYEFFGYLGIGFIIGKGFLNDGDTLF